MIWWWTSLVAAASPCPDVEILVEQAAEAFDDAEVELARARLTVASESLHCQAKVVPRATLLEMYHLDALASVAAEDPKAALYAIIRAVTLDPDVSPPTEVGPELLEQHRQWALRLRDDRLRVRATTADVSVWIDGQAVGLQPLTVLSGEHLVQMRGPDGWTNAVVQLVDGREPRSFPLILERPPVSARPIPVESGDIVEPEPTPRRVRRPALATGVGLGLAGAGLIGGGAALERRFHGDPYDASTYGACSRGQPCFASAREDRIVADARRVNALYLAGYVASGLGLGLVGVDLAVSRTSVGIRIGGVLP
jgi:hypothetical protein